jgi:hypothetical protein
MFNYNLKHSKSLRQNGYLALINHVLKFPENRRVIAVQASLLKYTMATVASWMRIDPCR